MWSSCIEMPSKKPCSDPKKTSDFCEHLNSTCRRFAWVWTPFYPCSAPLPRILVQSTLDTRDKPWSGGTDVGGLGVAPWNMVKLNIETVNKNRGSKHCVASIQQETCFHLSCRLKSQILSLEWKPSRQTMLPCFQILWSGERTEVYPRCMQAILFGQLPGLVVSGGCTSTDTSDKLGLKMPHF